MIGIVPQDIALYPTLNAWENLGSTAACTDFTAESPELDQRLAEQTRAHRCRQTKTVYLFGRHETPRVNLIAGVLHKPSILFSTNPPLAWMYTAAT